MHWPSCENENPIEKTITYDWESTFQRRLRWHKITRDRMRMNEREREWEGDSTFVTPFHEHKEHLDLKRKSKQNSTIFLVISWLLESLQTFTTKNAFSFMKNRRWIVCSVNWTLHSLIFLRMMCVCVFCWVRYSILQSLFFDSFFPFSSFSHVLLRCHKVPLIIQLACMRCVQYSHYKSCFTAFKRHWRRIKASAYHSIVTMTLAYGWDSCQVFCVYFI